MKAHFLRASGGAMEAFCSLKGWARDGSCEHTLPPSVLVGGLTRVGLSSSFKGESFRLPRANTKPAVVTEQE